MKHSSRIQPDCAGAVQRLPRNAGRAMIWIYRHTLSPLVGYNCRHLPTCSVYGDEAIERFGLWGGGWMTLARLLRCQPWGTSGIDNVPLTRPPGARWYLPWRFGRWRGVNAPWRCSSSPLFPPRCRVPGTSVRQRIDLTLPLGGKIMRWKNQPQFRSPPGRSDRHPRFARHHRSRLQFYSDLNSGTPSHALSFPVTQMIRCAP